MDEAKAVKLLAEVFRGEAAEVDERYEFKPRSQSGSLTVSLSKTSLSNTIAELNAKSRHSSLCLHDDDSMELLVREERPFPARSFRGEELRVPDNDNGVEYGVSAASDAYLLFFLDAISEHSDPRFLPRHFLSPMQESRLVERPEPLSVFELLRMGFLRITTLRVKCNTKTSPTRMSALANAFLFQLAFNTDVALVPQHQLETLARSSRISRMRRSRPTEIDPPRRTYNDDLIHH